MRTPTDARRVLAAALTLVVVGCSGGNTASATPSPAGPTPSPTPAQATDTQGKYRLVFELPASDWRASDAITGRATLSVVGSAGVDFGSSGQGPLAFQFDEVGGSRHMGGSMTADCVTYRLARRSEVDAGGPNDRERRPAGDGVARPPVGRRQLEDQAVLALGVRGLGGSGRGSRTGGTRRRRRGIAAGTPNHYQGQCRRKNSPCVRRCAHWASLYSSIRAQGRIGSYSARLTAAINRVYSHAHECSSRIAGAPGAGAASRIRPQAAL